MAGQLVAIAAGHALAFEPEGDVIEHRAVVERRVILKHHAAVGTGASDRLAEHEHFAGRGRMLRLQPGDQPQDRALAAAAGTEDAHELALVRQVGHDEVDVANRRELHSPGRSCRSC